MKTRVLDVFLGSVAMLLLTGMTTIGNLTEPARKGFIQTVTRLIRYLYEDLTGTSYGDAWD